MKKLVNGLISAGFILIIIGMVIQQNQIKKDNVNKQSIIDNQAIELIKYREENRSLYEENLKLEEENMACWNNYYMNVSNYEGYEYYE